MTTETKSGGDALVKILAALGILGLLFFVGWGTLAIARKYVPNAASSFSGAFSSLTSVFSSENITVSATPATVSSGSTLLVSWIHQNKSGDGTYALTYSCKEGVSFKTIDNDGILCDTPFTLAASSTSVSLIPLSETLSSVSVPITIAYTKTGETKSSVDGNTSVVINKSTTTGEGTVDTTPTSTPTTTPPAPTPVTPPKTSGGTGSTKHPAGGTITTYRIIPTGNRSYPVSDPNGRVDLEAKITAVGVVDKTTNVFTPTNSFRGSDRIAVKFQVTNIGTKTSPDWSFNAVLPTFPLYIFMSESQTPLAPGDSIEFTLAFDSVDQRSGNTAIVNVDPSNSINEITKANNIVRTTFDVTAN